MQLQKEVLSGNLCCRITFNIEQSIDSNTSTITVASVEAKSLWGNRSNCYVTGKVLIAGTTIMSLRLTSLGGCGVTMNGSAYATVSLNNVEASSIQISHNETGEATVNFSASFKLKNSSTLSDIDSVSGTDNMQLPTIARASSIVLSRESMQQGDAVTFQIERAVSTFTHTLKYAVGSSAEVTIHENVGTSASWTVPDLTAYFSGASEPITFLCYTYSGGSLIGIKSAAATVTVPASVATLSATAARIGDTVTISIARKQSGFVHDLTYTIGSRTATIVSGAGTSASWVVPDISTYITGAKATVTIRCTTKSGGTTVGTTTATIDVWAKASTISVSPTTVVMGGSVSIAIGMSASSFTHKLYYDFGSKKNQLIAENVASSYVWKIPDLSAEVSGLSAAATIRCDTYYGTTKVGSNECTINLQLQSAEVPDADLSFLCGSASTIQCRRPSSAYTVKLEYSFNGRAGTIAEGKFDNYSWTPPYSLASAIPDQIYGTGTITYTFKNGSTIVGTGSNSFVLQVPDNETTKPSFSASELTISRITSLTGDLGNLWIRGITGLRAAFQAASASSTITSYTITVGSLSASGNPAVIDLIADEGSVSYTATVTDARGFRRSVTGKISVYAYRMPKLVPYTGESSIICDRALENGVLSRDGTMLALKVGRGFSQIVVSGQNKNKCALRYRWRQGGGAWSGYTVLIPEDSTETQVSNLISNIVTSRDASYEVELSVVDTVGGEYTRIFQIMTDAISFVLFDGVDGAGFGKYPEAEHIVDIASHMKLYVRGMMKIFGAWNDLGLSSGVSEGSTGQFLGCGWRADTGRHIAVSACCSFSMSGGAKTLNSNPIPEEFRPPRTVRRACPMNGGGLAVLSVGTDGFISCESAADNNVIWVDGYIDYWI